ncbi:hypothetical protein DFQ28_000462 [Apophysomyces sp. BC1034]|nr:hypothetical protein DFQ30_000857 [Apophysomyces sp. BC1015]KAG0167713.1 hypothetical protein DFQ29_000298 [Apophysomyces sp. BC1021]KAG0183927.1 hypothetical protein DFQ28_000462 [Apophysomyces sp. BC1034]
MTPDQHQTIKHRQPRSTSPVRSAPYHPMKKSPHGPTASKWQQLVVGASSAAGTTAAVVSEESMKCLKYCLSWLQYAAQHITQQMAILRNFLVSLATSQSSALTTPGPNSSVLSAIKKEIVDTLRKVVDVISRYAGTSLPQHGKVAVRSFILNLPGRWASVNDIRSTATSPATSPMLGPKGETGTKRQEETAIRLLTFGQESVDMLQSISTVFSDSVERAELWIDRLRLGRTTDIHPIKDAKERDDLMQADNVRLPPIRTLDPPDQHCM